MQLVQGGDFWMGDSLGDADERPERRVQLEDFYIGKMEVTLAQFRDFVVATGYRTDAERGGGSYIWTNLGWARQSGINWRHDEKGDLRDTMLPYPVVHVSWNDALHYCNWLSDREQLRQVYNFSGDSVAVDTSANGYRLPSEAEWEYAAAGGKTQIKFPFSGSENLAEAGWYSGNARKSAHPVGQKKANALGLFDCSGNVWEWCQDEYAPGQRSVRGGSWSNNPRHCRISNRSSRFADGRDCNLGFRVARPAG